MQNEYQKILNGMNVRDDREKAEDQAIELYKKGENALNYLVDLGLTLKTKNIDDKIKTKIRSIVFTIAVFFKNNKNMLRKSPRYNELTDLMIDLSFLGFKSATKLLSDMGFSEYDVYSKKLLILPEVNEHQHDKEISIHEAYEEIRLSRSFTGSKGFLKDRYVLGREKKHTHEIFRIGKKLFALRVHKTK